MLYGHVADLSHDVGVQSAGGRSLGIEEISPEDWLGQLPRFLPSFVAKYLLDAWAAAIGQLAFVTSIVAELTGSLARTFLGWATDHAAQFGAGYAFFSTIQPRIKRPRDFAVLHIVMMASDVGLLTIKSDHQNITTKIRACHDIGGFSPLFLKRNR